MDSYIRRPYTFDRVVRIVFTVIGVICALWLLNVLKGVLLPFVVACLIAYMLEPLVKWNKRWMHLKSRFIPVIVTLLEVIIIVTGVCFLLVPYLIEEAESMGDMLRKYATTQIHIPYISNEVHRFIRENVNWNYVYKLFSHEEWKSILKTALTSSWTVVSSSFSWLISAASWLIVILYVIFIMIDYERLMLSFKQLVPHAQRRPVFHIFNDVKNSMNRYFRGQALIAFLVGILFSIGFIIIGLPMGVVLGLFIGLLNMVPYLQLISLPITAILCLVWVVDTGGNFWIIFWESMAVYVIVQCIQDLFLTPKIMGKAMGLNPAIILLSLSVWGCLLGFMGLIIALPLTTLVLSYYDQFVIQRSARQEVREALEAPSDLEEGGGV